LNITNEGKILEPEPPGERECPVKVKRGGLNRYPALFVHWTFLFFSEAFIGGYEKIPKPVAILWQCIVWTTSICDPSF
jgi:hypothetical protein